MNLQRKYREWRAYLETVSELTRCSDRSLDDLGIRREDIRTIARRKARGV